MRAGNMVREGGREEGLIFAFRGVTATVFGVGRTFMMRMMMMLRIERLEPQMALPLTTVLAHCAARAKIHRNRMNGEYHLAKKCLVSEQPKPAARLCSWKLIITFPRAIFSRELHWVALWWFLE